jgi:hypothetical protein
MRLVGESACGGNGAERIQADAHQVARKLDSALHHIGMGRPPEGLFEPTGKMSLTAPGRIAQVCDQYPCADMCVDVFAYTA